MFVFLSKFLPPLVYPLGLTCILIVCGLLLRKRPGWQRAVLLLAFGVLWLGGSRWVSYTLLRGLEWQNVPQGELPQVDAIVLLGGGTETGEAPRPMAELNGAGDRVVYAAKLYRDGKAPQVLISGGTTWMFQKEVKPSEDMRSLLVFMGVPDQAIWIQGKSQNTYEDALYCKAFLAEKGARRILLVTSATHMPRALALFRKQGLDVIAAPTDFKLTQSMWDELWEDDLAAQLIGFLPNVTNLGNSSNAIKEYIGYLVYRVRGWV